MARMKTAKGSLGRGVVGGKGSPRKGAMKEKRGRGHLDTCHTATEAEAYKRFHTSQHGTISAEKTGVAHAGCGGWGSRQGTG